MKEYKFDSVQAFYKEFQGARSDNAARLEWEKTYGDKMEDTTGIRDRLRQKEQIVKEREEGRGHQAKQEEKWAG